MHTLVIPSKTRQPNREQNPHLVIPRSEATRNLLLLRNAKN
jgi:hypothetical protein